MRWECGECNSVIERPGMQQHRTTLVCSECGIASDSFVRIRAVPELEVGNLRDYWLQEGAERRAPIVERA